MKGLLENEAFCTGFAVGINAYQQKVVMAEKQGKPILIDGELFYIQNGRDRLLEVIEKLCE